MKLWDVYQDMHSCRQVYQSEVRTSDRKQITRLDISFKFPIKAMSPFHILFMITLI